MKKLIAIPLLVAAMMLTAHADVVKLPKADSIATITVPDGWKVEASDESAEISSSDDEVYMYVEVLENDSVEAAIKESLAFLEKEKVKVDEKSMKKNEGKINDIPTVDLSFDGTDKDGPCKISLTFFVINEKHNLSFLYWASPEGEKKHEKDLVSIAQSIKRAK